MNLIPNIYSEILLLKSLPHLPEANEFIQTKGKGKQKPGHILWVQQYVVSCVWHNSWDVSLYDLDQGYFMDSPDINPIWVC